MTIVERETAPPALNLRHEPFTFTGTGREYFGIVRSTFLVDAQGIVRKAWRGVRVAGHVDAVLSAAKELR